MMNEIWFYINDITDRSFKLINPSYHAILAEKIEAVKINLNPNLAEDLKNFLSIVVPLVEKSYEELVANISISNLSADYTASYEHFVENVEALEKIIKNCSILAIKINMAFANIDHTVEYVTHLTNKKSLLNQLENFENLLDIYSLTDGYNYEEILKKLSKVADLIEDFFDTFNEEELPTHKQQALARFKERFASFKEDLKEIEILMLLDRVAI